MLPDLIAHLPPLDQVLHHWLQLYGPWALGLVALIVFAETGLVVAPFLPGDSLLFLTGTLAAGASMSIGLTIAVLWGAAVAGDALNFAVGQHAMPLLQRRSGGRWPRPDHLAATEAYFDRYGHATIVVARFVPIVRTLAPFMAGAGRMHAVRFTAYNVLGGGLWVASFVIAGVAFGRQPWVQAHLGALTVIVVALSLLPLGFVIWRRGAR